MTEWETPYSSTLSRHGVDRLGKTLLTGPKVSETGLAFPIETTGPRAHTKDMTYTADVEFTGTMTFVVTDAPTEDTAVAVAREALGTSEYPASIGGEAGAWSIGFESASL